jgi:hypothetical protein
VSEAKRALDDGGDAAVRPSVRLKHETRVSTRFAGAETMSDQHHPAGAEPVELHLVGRPPVTAGLVEAVIQQVREVADDRGLGPCVDRVSILFEDFETCGS